MVTIYVISKKKVIKHNSCVSMSLWRSTSDQKFGSYGQKTDFGCFQKPQGLKTLFRYGLLLCGPLIFFNYFFFWNPLVIVKCCPGNLWTNAIGHMALLGALWVGGHNVLPPMTCQTSYHPWPIGLTYPLTRMGAYSSIFGLGGMEIYAFFRPFQWKIRDSENCFRFFC